MSDNVCINPLYLNYHSNLRSACQSFNSVKKKYGEDSAEYKSAFTKRQMAEQLFCNCCGIIEAKSPLAAKPKKEVEGILDSKQNEVKSWYA